MNTRRAIFAALTAVYVLIPFAAGTFFVFSNMRYVHAAAVFGYLMFGGTLLSFTMPSHLYARPGSGDEFRMLTFVVSLQLALVYFSAD